MNKKLISNFMFVFGVVGMCVTIAGTFLEGGVLLQKIFFLSGALALTLTAIYNKHPLYMALQGVIIIGAVLGFFSNIATEYKYVILLIPTIAAIIYLIYESYFRRFPCAVSGAIGLVFIALGFSVDAVSNPWLFNLYLVIGGAGVALYSGAYFFHSKDRIAVLWFVLNVVFSINPLIYLITGA